MGAADDPKDAEIANLKRRLAREEGARREAERIGEDSLRKLYDRAQEIGLIQAITAASNEARTVEEVLRIAVREVCRYTRWPVGHAWLLADDRSGKLVSTGIWHLERGETFRVFRDASDAMRLPAGVGLPGRVLGGGKPAWIVDVTKDPGSPRASQAGESGLRAGFAFPVLVETEVVGVLEFFSAGATEPDDALLQTMGLIGIQLGRVVERSRTERMRQDFVAMLVHDIKTPLAAVLGFAHLLSDDIPEGLEAREMLDRIEANAQQATALTVNLLDAQRIESGRLELQREEISLNEIVRHVLRHQASRIRLSKITIDFALDELLPDVPADRRLVDRVIANLLSNAIKFSPPGGTVRVKTQPDGNRARLSVRDQGPGIPPENRDGLFRRFGFSSASRPDSSGLGLFIVQTIVTAHGGEVAVSCPPSGGSEFTVWLPIGDDPEGRAP